jgi:methylase of polypeptide subunit release factors
MTISAILRNVSNADTRHVFPGISKRMRKLEAEGKIHIDVRASFARAIKKRAEYYDIYKDDVNAEIILADSSQADVEALRGKVDLIVTNPPYISSVRYIETLKIEMYWMEYVKNNVEYFTLADKMLGNDHLAKKDYETVGLTKYDEINVLIEEMKLIDMKNAKIIEVFFNNIEKVIEKMSIVLKSGGKAVIKISDSKIRKTKVETVRFMTLIAENYGFKLKDVFLDEINNNSRSLTTARNTYSDIITHDYIIIWEKM